jgi:hypothetical protein
VPPVNGVPVRWDGCKAVHFTTRTAYTYAGAHDDIVAALAQISARTGLVFVDDGEVNTVPTVGYGTRLPSGAYPPLLIGWTTAEESDLFKGAGLSTVGVAGSYYVGGKFVSGRVALERNRMAGAARTGPHSVRTLLLHEIGHAIGLGHFTDASQIMNPYLVNYDDWGAGDMTGLSGLATTTCAATVGPQSAPDTDDLQAAPLAY